MVYNMRHYLRENKVMMLHVTREIETETSQQVKYVYL